MKKRIRILLIMMFMFCSLTSLHIAQAQQVISPAKTLVKQLNTMDILQEMAQTYRGKIEQQSKMLSMLSRDANKEVILSATINSSFAAINKAFNSQDIESLYVEQYTSSFTEDELQVLSQFFKTPLGTKFIRQSDEINKTIAAKMEPRMQVMHKALEESQKSLMKLVGIDMDAAPNTQ